ncbi:hypothetical protein [Mycolicibacterium grossiae]|nr:hypothetical protein [Mycolicibacterium grossiae]QEM46605.1 hypothetical protein FZ046_19145 [Mycolicibacterium grossiae]
MSFWTDKDFDEHPVWEQVAQFARHMDELPRDLDPPQRLSVVRLKTALELLSEHQQRAIKEHYTASMLDVVHSHLTGSVNPSMSTFVSDPDSYGNHVNTAADQVDQIFDYVAQWPSLPAGGQAQAAGKAFREYKEEAETALEVLKEKNDELQAELVQLKSQMTTVEGQMGSVEDRYSTSLEARDAEYSDAVARIEESGKEAYDKAIQADVESRSAQLQKLVDDGDELVKATEAHRAAAEKLALAAEGSAEWLAKRAFARDFGMQARRKSAAAWLYDFLGTAVIAAPVYFVLKHFLDNQDSDGTVAVSLTRLSIIVGAVILGGYLFSRGATNHRQARASKSAEIRLNTFEAFISALDEDEQAEIRNGMAKTIYLRGRLADEEPDSPNPFGKILDAIADRSKSSEVADAEK